MGDRYKVLLFRCDEYDPGRIGSILCQGMEALGVKPRGNVLIKPNAVLAHPRFFPYAFTRPEFLEGTITALKGMGARADDIKVGERSGITIPTRFCFKHAGYFEVLKRQAVRACCFDEVMQVPVKLGHPDALRDLIFLPKDVVGCDFFVNLPKFKAHPWTRLTLCQKNLVGIQDDRHRLLDHNTYLEHKIADLQEVIKKQFIAVDAIVAGQKMMLTPTPYKLGAIVMGTNQCAVDTVCSHMVNVDPAQVAHLRLASERGYGPISLDQIDIEGDYLLEEIQAKTGDFQFCLERIDSYFGPQSNLSCTVGSFPEEHSRDYCWGGCPGALQEAMHILRAFNPGLDKRMKKIRYVVGRVEGPLDLEEDERVIFAGDCTAWEGEIDGKRVKIEPRYRRKEEIDPRTAPSSDMILKNLASLWECLKSRSSRYVRAYGCPFSVAEHVNYLSALGGVKNPNFDHRLFFSVNVAYWQMRFMRFLNRLLD